MLDYDDILIYFAALLEDETIGKLIRQRWSHVMVDEYQDTNAIQLEIVYGLAGEQENIFIVGDPSQSIYGFRGTAPPRMTEFCKRFQRAKIHRKSTRLNSSHSCAHRT